MPCLIEAHRVSVTHDAESRIQAEQLEGKVQAGKSELERLSKELANIKLGIKSS